MLMIRNTLNKRTLSLCSQISLMQSCSVSHTNAMCVQSTKRIQRIISKHKINPGIKNRLYLLEEHEREEVLEEDLENMDDEIDVGNAHMAYEDHKKELETNKDLLRFHITKSKYFKEHEERFLSWEDRQQIQYLHRTDPEKWNVKELASSFPITELGVKKILKANWKPESRHRIEAYNKYTERNWQLLLKNKLDVPENVKSHILKFVPRINIQSAKGTDFVPATGIKKPNSTQFVSIVRGNETSKEINNRNIQQNQNCHSNEDTFVIQDYSRSRSERLITLDKLKEKLSSSVQPLENIGKTLISDTRDNEIRQPVSVEDYKGVETKEPEPKISHVVETQVNIPPENITIPIHLKRRGKLFKFNDCYYNKHGEFLYRVPGMS